MWRFSFSKYKIISGKRAICYLKMLNCCIESNMYSIYYNTQNVQFHRTCYDKFAYFDIFNKQTILAKNSECTDYDHFLFNLVCLTNECFKSYFA